MVTLTIDLPSVLCSGRFYAAINYLLLKLFTEVFYIWLPLGKIMVELILFIFSYTIQRFVLFIKSPMICDRHRSFKRPDEAA